MRFVLIDRLITIVPGERATASVRFAADNEIFADHFPGSPVVPGVLITEAMAQTAGWLLSASSSLEHWPLLVMIANAKFRRVVGPEEPLQLTATVRTRKGDLFEVDAEAHAGGDRVANARLVFRIFARLGTEHQRIQFAAWAERLFAELDGPAAQTRRADHP